jgi:hypothetical protein
MCSCRKPDKIAKQIYTGEFMTPFQIVSAVLFSVLVVLAYRKEIAARLKLVRPSLTPLRPAVQSSIAVPLVEDIMAVTQLRDKLAAEGCKEGVDACTALLRVIVEYEQPSKGVI